MSQLITRMVDTDEHILICMDYLRAVVEYEEFVAMMDEFKTSVDVAD
jgi:hypothetical protein